MYTYEQVLESSKKYFNGNELSAKVFVDKYALKNNDGEYLELTPEDMHRRIAKELARIERGKFQEPLSEDFIFSKLDRFLELIPQGSPMYGIGNYYQYATLSNCYVIASPSDSYGGIMKADEEIAQLSKRRGGVGCDISNLRPKDAAVKNAARTTSGAVSFMERFSNTLREVGQYGRRGAGMITISVHHPDILDFVNVKRDLTKVTGANISVRLTNEFLEAVDKGTDYELRYPVVGKPEISKMVDARQVWSKIIDSAHAMAEPGLLFWDNIIKESPADCYKEDGFETISTNPCITGDTLVLVADGRGHVPIKQLVEEGKDVDVFCFDQDRRLSISKMRNPRVSGYNQPIYKVLLENGHTIKVTGNHKFLSTNGEYFQAKDLVPGDSLEITSVYDSETHNNNVYRYRVLSNRSNNIFEHKLIAEYNYGVHSQNYEVHHIDHNPKNNNPKNLIYIDRQDHANYHSIGLNNSNAKSVDNDELKKYAITLTKKLGRRFSHKEWVQFAKKNNLPMHFTQYRRSKCGNITDLAKLAALECGVDHLNEDPRVVKTYKNMLDMGYDCEIKDGTVFVYKECENCKSNFTVEHSRRERSFCSIKCSSNYNKDIYRDENTKKLNDYFNNKSKSTKNDQVKIFNDLKFKLQREPFLKEWVAECKESKIPFRFKTKYGFKSYEELKNIAANFNHRVVSVQKVGFDNVYTGTVDNHHNFFVGGWEEYTKGGHRKFIYINNLQCGELPLSAGDSCRLLALNLFSFVDNPYTNKAEFNFDRLYKSAQIAQRLMDDIIDLELEAIDRILDKIKSDPENEDVKHREITLWSNIRKACENGRRTGTGITALGDTMAACNIKYGSNESVEFSEKIYQTLKLGCYRSSVDMAKELGAFPVWDKEKEEDHPFLNRIKDENLDLWEDMQKYGRRNISLLTTAPTGSLSIEAGIKVQDKVYHNTTSGIEPLFMTGFTRRKKGNPGDKNFRSDFVDQNGDHWMEFTVYHEPVLAWHSVNQDKNIEENPYSDCCASQIDWINRVRIQSRANLHVDHSISATVNLPESVSKEEVSSIYLEAWKSGCKGITVYRDNCRTGVLVNKTEEKNEAITKTKAPKRPKSLPCNVYHITVKGIPYFVLIGLLNNEPYEVFAGKNKNGNWIVPPSVTNGIVTKKSRGKYHAAFNDGTELLPITAFCEDEEEALTRLVSTALRHGADLSFLVHQLEKANGDMQSFSKCIARALKKVIKDGTVVSGEECPECQNQLVRQEGCISCMNCGFTKCG